VVPQCRRTCPIRFPSGRPSPQRWQRHGRSHHMGAG
jgi:hypothetical protein